MEDNVATNGQQISFKSKKFIALEKRVSVQMKEFNSRIELGRKLNKIVNKYNRNVYGWENDIKEALKTYKYMGCKTNPGPFQGQ